MRATYAYLDCGIPENGVARVFCDEWVRDFFLAFSYRQRALRNANPNQVTRSSQETL